MTALDRLLDRIGDPLDASKPRPLVTLEEFFTENNDAESLGNYARSKFAPQSFFAALVELRNGSGFDDIRVEVLPQLSPSGRPFANTFWIVSRFDRTELPTQLTLTLGNGFLPCDWLSYPRIDKTEMESLAIPDGACAQGLAYY